MHQGYRFGTQVTAGPCYRLSGLGKLMSLS